MKELAEEYRKSAELLRQRMGELRAALKGNLTEAERFNIERRLATLTPMLTDCNKIAELCERYYEKGFYRDERYTICGYKQRLSTAKKFITSGDCETGVDPTATRSVDFVPYRWQKAKRNSRRTRCVQVDYIQNAIQSNKARDKNNEIPLKMCESDEEKLAKFFFKKD